MAVASTMCSRYVICLSSKFAPHPDIAARRLHRLTASNPAPIAALVAGPHRHVRSRRHLKVCSPDNDFMDIKGTKV
jgi:hypothetical protein